MSSRFHWMMLKGGESGRERASTSNRIVLSGFTETGLPDLENRVRFCRAAEESGMDSVLTAFGYYEPDPLLLAAALGLRTEKLRFIIAYRSGLQSPPFFVQQVNTLSALIGGRVSLNIVAGHSPKEQRSYGDYLAHDERYERTAEFLAVCRALWAGGEPVDFAGTYYQVEQARLNTPFLSENRSFPEIYVGGQSQPARDLAVSQGSCWLCMAEAPETLAERIRPVLDQGVEVGLRMGVIVRPTREEAVRDAYSLIAGVADAKVEAKERAFVAASDSVSIKSTLGLADRASDWVTSCLWSGAVSAYGAPSMALVGTPEEVAAAIGEYEEAGITQFILHGWPKLDEMVNFGKEVLPLVRARERALAS